MTFSPTYEGRCEGRAPTTRNIFLYAENHVPVVVDLVKGYDHNEHSIAPQG